MKSLGDSLQILVVVNCRRGEELRHLFQHNLPEITGKLANGTPWTVTTKSIVVGKKRYPAYIQEDSSGDLMLLTGPRKEADYLRQRLLGIR